MQAESAVTIEMSILGKSANVRLCATFSWLAVCDSHGSHLTRFFEQNGASTVVISGGGLEHADEFFKDPRGGQLLHSLNAIFILLGGNDVAQGHAPHVITYHLRRIIINLSMVRPECRIVTASYIPRSNRVDGGDQFIRDTERVDRLIKKACPNHHHLLSDAFIGDMSEKGAVTTRKGLYNNDKIHLNSEGRQQWQQILSFAFTAVNRDDYSHRMEVPGFYPGGTRIPDFRVAFFKF